ncbi:MAG: MBL fold metallo-hydrolase [Myxococcota bacterium]
MNRRLLVLIIAGVLALLAIPVGIVVVGFAMAFMSNLPATDGETLADGQVTLVKDSFVNLYVVDAGEGVLLIDAGQSAESVVAAVAKHGVEPADVRAIFLTHGHGDHTGGIAAFPTAKVYALAAEQPILTGQVAPPGPMSVMMGKHDSHATLERELLDGDRVQVGEVEVQVFSTPGHTPGSAVYLVRGVVFFGDTAGASVDGTVEGSPWVFSGDVGQNHASLVDLAKKVDPDSIVGLAFGHTGTMQGGSGLAAFAAE